MAGFDRKITELSMVHFPARYVWWHLRVNHSNLVYHSRVSLHYWRQSLRFPSIQSQRTIKMVVVSCFSCCFLHHSSGLSLPCPMPAVSVFPKWNSRPSWSSTWTSTRWRWPGPCQLPRHQAWRRSTSRRRAPVMLGMRLVVALHGAICLKGKHHIHIHTLIWYG